MTFLHRAICHAGPSSGFPRLCSSRNECIPFVRRVGDKSLLSGASVFKPDRRARVLLTLRPEKMLELGQKSLDISGFKGPNLRIPQGKGDPGSFRSRPAYRQVVLKDTKSMVPFPPGTKGVFYYHPRPGLPPAFAELRFRVCDSPRSFQEGYDLLHHSSPEPWAIPLFRIAEYENYEGFRQLLLNDGLVSEELLAEYAIPSSHYFRTILHDIHQPFIAKLHQKEFRIWLLDGNNPVPYLLANAFSDTRRRNQFRPYSGTVKVRFVQSTLPEHAENPALLLEFVELLSPVHCVVPGYDGHMEEPRVGNYRSYLSKKRKGVYKPRAISLKRVSQGKFLSDFLGQNMQPRQERVDVNEQFASSEDKPNFVTAIKSQPFH